MKAKHFIVAERPRLAKAKHPKVAFGEYERQLRSMQLTMQAVQQAYLGTRERAVIVLERMGCRRQGWSRSATRLGHGPTKLQGLSGRRAVVA